MVNHSISMRIGRYWHQSFWNEGPLSACSELSRFFIYELHIKGTVLCLWSFIRCIRIWIVICYRRLKFPHKALVLLVLESDASCTSFNGHSIRKFAVLVYLFWFLWKPLWKFSRLSEVQITKCEITVSVCVLEGTDTRTSGMRDHFLHVLNYQDFLFINSILKELYCVCEASLDVLELELFICYRGR